MPGHGEVAHRARRSASGSGTSRRCSTCAAQPAATAHARGLQRACQPDRRPAARRRPARRARPIWSGSSTAAAPSDRGSVASSAALAREALLERVGVDRSGDGGARRAAAGPHGPPDRREADRIAERRVDVLAGPSAGRVCRRVEQLPEASRRRRRSRASPASSVRLAASTTGRPRSRQARASGRCRARLPASTTTRIASGAASRRYVQNGSSPAGSSSSERVPGQVHQPRLATADRDEAPLEAHGRAGRIGRLDEAAAGPGEEGGLADVRAADHGHDRPPVGPRRPGGCRGPGVAGRSRHQAGSSDAARGRVCTCAAILVESASRARPSSTTSGPPSGVRAATTTTLPTRMPSRSSSDRSGPSMPVITRRQPTGAFESGSERLASRSSRVPDGDGGGEGRHAAQ